MLDARLHRLNQALLEAPARRLARAGLTASHATIAGFLIGLAAAPAIATGHFTLALILILINRAMDGLDGALARLEGPTDCGAFLDIAFDFFFYATVPFAFAWASPQANALPAAFLLLSFIGTGSSFLALASLTARRGLTAQGFPKKGIYYIGGLTEGFETIVLFALICLWPHIFPAAAWVFGALCLATTALRWHWGARLLA